MTYFTKDFFHALLPHDARLAALPHARPFQHGEKKYLVVPNGREEAKRETGERGGRRAVTGHIPLR